MKLFRCNECGATFALDDDLVAEDLECPIERCRGSDLNEFEEVEIDGDEEDDDDA